MTNPRRTTLVLYTCIFSASILYSQTATADSADLKDLVHEVQSLRQELKEIKDILQTQQTTLPVGATRSAKLSAPATTEIVLPFVPQQSTGDEHAKYVVVEFADLQCPFCSYFNKNAFPTFETEYVKTGKVRFLNVDFPLESHPDAAKLSLASLCAGDEGKYWQMRDAILKSTSPSSTAVDEMARSLGLDQARFRSCTQSETRLTALKENAAAANASGVSGTPSFIVGRVRGGKVYGTLLVGALSAEDLSQKVNAAIAKMEENGNAKTEQQAGMR